MGATCFTGLSEIRSYINKYIKLILRRFSRVARIHLVLILSRCLPSQWNDPNEQVYCNSSRRVVSFAMLSVLMWMSAQSHREQLAHGNCTICIQPWRLRVCTRNAAACDTDNRALRGGCSRYSRTKLNASALFGARCVLIIISIFPISWSVRR